MSHASVPPPACVGCGGEHGGIGRGVLCLERTVIALRAQRERDARTHRAIVVDLEKQIREALDAIGDERARVLAELARDRLGAGR